MKKIIILVNLFIVLNSFIIFAYSMGSNAEVHQHITNESKFVWTQVPEEIKNHLTLPINSTLDSFGFAKYDSNEDIIIGSGEEDLTPVTVGTFFTNHYWSPDNPQNGNYNKGLDIYKLGIPIITINLGSSYQKGLGYWQNDIIPHYTGITQSAPVSVDQDKAYYYLGRTAHLLEDASQPSHMLLDCHVGSELNWVFLLAGYSCQGASLGDAGNDDSVLEENTGNNYLTLRDTYNFKGSNFAGQQYNYENLPNLDSFNWNEIQPTGLTQDQLNLFKLFWYTAQKTQYLASDDADGNTTYVNLTGSNINFSTSLWQGDGVTIIDKKEYLVQDDINDVGKNVSLEANATIPHAMKAVAGLYRLFWNTVRDQLRLQVPTKDYVFGGVKQDSYWFTELNLTQDIDSPHKLNIELSWQDGSDLNLIITNTTNNNITATNNQGLETIEISPASKGNYQIWVKGITVSGNTYSQFKVTAQKLSGPPVGPGGINFTSIDLNYISTCNPENGLEAVFKGKENDGTETQVDTSNATNQSINCIKNNETGINIILNNSLKNVTNNDLINETNILNENITIDVNRSEMNETEEVSKII